MRASLSNKRREALERARAASATARQRKREEGLAFARAWRESNKGRDWSLPASTRIVCATCNQVVA